MYLVTIERRLSSSGTQICQKIEEIQCFGYQLKSERWSVIDVTPKKGASFEVHFGDDHVNDEEAVVGVFLTNSAKDALTICVNSDCHFDNLDCEESIIKSDVDYAVCLYLENETNANYLLEVSNM